MRLKAGFTIFPKRIRTVPVLFILLSIFCNFICVSRSVAALSKEDLKEIRTLVREEMQIFSYQIDKRFEQIDKRLEELRQDMNHKFSLISGIFTAMFLGTLSFAFWDRKTMIRPFETKVKAIETVIGSEKGERVKLTDSLKELSKTDTKLAGILQRFNIL